MIYLDNAATTKIHPEVLEAMMPYLTEEYGNPSSLHKVGESARRAIQEARKTIAETINADPDDIIFTSGGTESDNLAIKIAEEYSLFICGHVITSEIEHPAVLNSVKDLNTKYIPVDEYGYIDPYNIEKEINNDTGLVSIMYANNEIGTIQDIKTIGSLCRKYGIPFHVDAVQAYGHIDIDVERLNIDFLSVSGHKIHGPKGIGFLYVRNAKAYTDSPLLKGGHQEFGLRPGTENVAGIVGLAKAAKLACKRNDDFSIIQPLRNYLMDRILKEIPDTFVNGGIEYRLSSNLNVCFKGIKSEELLILLSESGICVSAGSACASSSGKPSHVLKAIGLSDEDANASIRFSLGSDITKEDLDYTVEVLKRNVKMLRSISS